MKVDVYILINVEAEEVFTNLSNDIRSHTIDWFLKTLKSKQPKLINYYPGSLYWREIYETDVNYSYKEVVTNIVSK